MHETRVSDRWTVPDDYRLRWVNTSLPVPVDGIPVLFQPLTGAPPPQD